MTRWRVGGLIVIGLFAFLHGSTLYQWPDVHGDEAAEMLHAASPQPSPPLFSERFGFLNRNRTETYRPGYSWILSRVFRVAGVGFPQARALSLLAAMFMLAVFYWISFRYFSEPSAFFSLIFLSADPLLGMAAHTARPETCLSAFALAAYAVLLPCLRSSQWPQAFGAGLMAGLAALIHPNGTLLVPALGCVSLLAWPSSPRAWRVPLAFMLGAGVGLGTWLCLMPTDQLTTHRLLWRDWGQEIPLLSGQSLWGSFVAECQRYWNPTPPYAAAAVGFFKTQMRLEYAGLLGLFAFALPRARKDVRLAAPMLMSGLILIGMAFCVTHKNPLYLSLLSPFFALGVCVALDTLRPFGFVVAGIWLAGVTSLGYFYQTLQRKQPLPYERVCAQLREVIPPNSRVLGRGDYWVCRQDCVWLDANVLTFEYWLTNSTGVGADAIQRLHPDYLFVHPALIRFFRFGPLESRLPFRLTPLAIVPGQNPEEPHWVLKVEYPNARQESPARRR